MRPAAVGHWRTHSGFLNSGLQLDRGMMKSTDKASATSSSMICASRFRVLLRGSRGSLPESGRAVHHLGPQDVTLGGGVESCRLAGLTAYGRRRTMRVSLSAGGLGESPTVPRPALPEAGPTEHSRRARAVPIVRYAGVPLSRIRHQYDGCHLYAGLVLQSAGGRGESDQGSQ